MAESLTARLGLPRWSAQSDSPNRAEFDGAMRDLEANAAMFAQGTLAARPTPTKVGRIYVVVGDPTAALNGQTYYDTGAAWLGVGSVVLDQRVRSSAVGVVSQTIQAIANQTAALTQWLKEDGSVGASVDKGGAGLFAGLRSTLGLTVDQVLTVLGNLDARASAAIQGNLDVAGVSTLNVLRSTALRSTGSPRTQIQADGFARLDYLIPPGTIVMHAGPSIPPGWFLCDGSAVSRTDHQELYNYIGTYFGGGNGSTTFNLPDLRHRIPRGALGASWLGASEGVAVDSRPGLWGHTVYGSGTTSTNPGHVHGIDASVNGAQANNAQLGGTAYRPTGAFEHAHGGQTQSSGQHSHSIGFTSYGDAHPFLGVNFLIKW